MPSAWHIFFRKYHFKFDIPTDNILVSTKPVKPDQVVNFTKW